MKDKKERVTLYGLGNAGKAILPYLRERYEIVFWVDGNRSLWETEYEGISVRPPESLLEYDGKVIVTTTDSFFGEISDYLLKIGFDKNSIVRGQYPVCDQIAEVVPYEVEMLRPEKVDLRNCDLLKRTEKKSTYRVMVFCAFYTPYVNQLVRNCKKLMPDIHFGILTNSEAYLNELEGYADHIYVYHSYSELYGILNELPKYDVFQILWIENIWVYFRNMIRKKCRRLNLSVGGSDLYRAREAERIYKRHLVDMADIINAQTNATISAFVKAYPSAVRKIRWVNYGIEALECMGRECMLRAREKRKRMGIPNDMIVIMCGYNASEAHQHVSLIQALSGMDEFVKEKITLVLPMTYPNGQESYIEKVERYLRGCGIRYRILTEYMNIHDMAEIEMLSDILITVQTTDQLSSTMLETMYAGKVIIAGSWLPYEDLRKKGIFFVPINEIADLTKMVAEVVTNYRVFQEKCLANKKIVYDMSSWNVASMRWHELWKN